MTTTTVRPGNRIKALYILLLCCFAASEAGAQTIYMSAIPQTLTCPTSAVFVDPQTDQSGVGGDATCQTGGSSFDYQDNMNITQTFCTANGQCITLNYSSLFPFTLCSSDTLYIYDGPSTSSSLLSWGTTSNGGGGGFFTNYSGGPSTTTVQSSGPCVTFKFVSDASTHARGWRITFSCSTCVPAPSNDNITGSQLLTVGSSCTYTTGSTFHASSASTCSTAPACTGSTLGAGNSDDDVWYKFTTGSTQTSATVTVHVQGVSSMDAVFQVFSGSCGTLSQVTCVNSNLGGIDESGTFTVTPNTSYYVRVYDYANNGSTNASSDAFQICVIGGTQNDCSGASQVCSTTQISHNNTGGTGTQEYGTGTWGCLFGEHNSAWYTFKASASGTLSFNIASNGGTFQDIDWAVWGPFTSSSSICTLTPILSSSYAVSNANPGCGLPVYSTGLSTCETGGTNCEGAGGNGTVVAFNQPVSIISGDYYLLLVDIFAGNTSYYINWLLTGGAAFDATYGSGCVVLPISILEFNGEVEGDVNHLYWSTASEENNSYFALERSGDGERFDSIGRVEGAGNSAVQLNYQFLDTHPINGINYYRLRQVDNDGQYSYSNIIELENSSSGLSIESVYPNPTNGLTNVDINSNEEATVILDVFDGLSRVILHSAASVKKGSNTLSVDLTNYPAGVYYLNCQSISKKIKVFAKVVKN